MELNFDTGPKLPATPEDVWAILQPARPLHPDWRRRYRMDRTDAVMSEFTLVRSRIAEWVCRRAIEDRTDYLVDFRVRPFDEEGTYCHYRALLDPREKMDDPALMYWRVFDTATMQWVTPGLIHSLGRTVCSAGADDPERPSATVAPAVAPAPETNELMELA